MCLAMLLVCAAAPLPLLPADDDVRITGPGWELLIADGQARLSGSAVTATSEPIGRPSFAKVSTHYIARTMRVVVRLHPCDGGAEGTVATVTLSEPGGKRELTGCAVGGVGSADLAGTNWQLERHGDTPVLSARYNTIRFADGSIAGTAGCTRFAGTFRVRWRQLVTDVRTTPGRCPGPAAAQESALFAMLATPARLSARPDGRLVLTAEGRETLVLRQR